ncbi:MAG: hypothetical protein ABFR47_07840, partial [Verrucomicrobiota bacterium]
MDNTGILYGKDKEGLEVHRISQDFHGLDLRYGLTILAGNPRQMGGSMPEPENRVLRYYEFYSISHLLEGEGVYYFPETGEAKPIQAGQAVIVTPGTVHRYGATGSKFVESFLLFTGPIADYLCDIGIILNGIWEMGKVPRLNRVLELAVDPSFSSQVQANVTLQQILIDIHNMNRLLQSEKTHPLLVQLIEEIKYTPERWWTVAEMAAYCKVSAAYFRILFREYTGQAPKRYIDESKVRLAATLLCSSHLTVH